jgi:UDP-N-acetylglucosamine--N-acetylmuramyl-(pentapeptide) pyrophosphoryl-undecaprenol N-acetylglucosamine transferase
MEHPTIFISGGHLTPAIAVIEEIKKTHPDWQIIFVGREHAMENDLEKSEEYITINEMGIKFVNLDTGRLRRFMSFVTISSIGKVPLGIIRAIKLCRQFQPQLIFSFGGYIGLPLVFAGWILRIPSMIHEQTYKPGLSNKIAALFANRVLLSFPETMKMFPKSKTKITGLPVRQDIFSPPINNKLNVPDNRPLIYITGGATGSDSINKLIYPILPKLLKDYTVVHQVGRNWISQARQNRLTLRGDKRKFYYALPYVDVVNHAWLIHHAQLVISRSGANTVAEIAICGVVSVLLPLPWSANQEQQANALALTKLNTCTLVDQNNLTTNDFYKIIMNSLTVSKKPNPDLEVAKIYPPNAAALIVREIHSWIKA